MHSTICQGLCPIAHERAVLVTESNESVCADVRARRSRCQNGSRWREGPSEVGVTEELQPSDPDRIGPSRALPLRPALVAALSVPGCRAVYAVTFGLDGDALAAAAGDGFTYLWDMAGGGAPAAAHPRPRGGV